MNFANHWVPTQVMHIIFLLWALSALIVVVLLIWLKYMPSSSKCTHKKQVANTGYKRRKRKK